MKDFIHDGSTVNRPNNALDIYLQDLGSESPKLVRLIMEAIHKDNKRNIKHIGSKSFGIQYLLRGLYTHNGLLYFHTQALQHLTRAFRYRFYHVQDCRQEGHEAHGYPGAGHLPAQGV